MPPKTLEEARNQPGRREQIEGIVKQIEAQGIKYAFFHRSPSPAASWRRVWHRPRDAHPGSRTAASVQAPLPPGTSRTLSATDQETDMANATQLGQTGLQGWREKVADGISQPVAKRAPLDEDQVRAIVGAAFFVLAVLYVVKTISAATRQARQG